MTLEIKDAVYVILYFISVAGVFLSFKYKLNNLEREIKTDRQIIWGSQGRLNIIDNNTCKERRDQIYNTIRKSDTIIEGINNKLESMNENVIRIMVHLRINGKDSKNQL